MEGVEAVEAGLDLQLAEQDLHAALRETPPDLGAEQRSARIELLALSPLVAPEARELRLEAVGQEDVAGTPTLGDLSAQSNPDTKTG